MVSDALFVSFYLPSLSNQQLLTSSCRFLHLMEVYESNSSLSPYVGAGWPSLLDPLEHCFPGQCTRKSLTGWEWQLGAWRPVRHVLVFHVSHVIASVTERMIKRGSLPQSIWTQLTYFFLTPWCVLTHSLILTPSAPPLRPSHSGIKSVAHIVLR